MKSIWIPGLAVALTAGTLMAADEVAAVDNALVAAFDKGDTTAINRYLDASGVLTEVQGK